MPWIAAVLGGLFAGLSRLIATRAGAWIATAAVALGLTMVTTEVVMEPALDMVQSAMGGLPGSVAQWVGVLKFPVYISMVLSAYAAGGIKRAVLARRAA